VGVTPNEALQLTKRDHSVGGPALACLRRAIFIESRFAAERRCSTYTNDGRIGDGLLANLDRL